ncbi:hAT family dimerization protein [Rhizoctonia solani]|uniref:HAT family dimerization protein n=1 Tax=Rhizoctonia solani TaxID=456999 RepID=A0A8H8P3B7_9AGAM|nr:hAT family dimerization protein [Rhizoctonia solani]QRW24445.1 hAT family dimerization protein [Rhizoctonia solani]
MSSILGKQPLSSYSNDCFVGKRQKTLATLVDKYAWDYKPEELIDAAKPNMRSPAYPHYNIQVEKTHKAFKHACLNTSAGTTAMLHSAEDCDWEWEVLTTPNWNKPEPYLPEFHCALLALWGACSHRSFDSLTNKFHQQEVDYLCPGTKLLLSKTLLHDIKLIHTQFVPKIKEYFASISSAVHVAVNGWTSPTSESYLGVVVIWYNKPQIYCCVLEFICLTSAHTGAYLAGKIASSQQASNTGDNGELDNSEAADIDKAKFEHNTLVVQAVVYQALEQLLSMHSLILTAQDLCDAQAIMTTVANLACRVDESPMLKTKFQEYLLCYPELKESTWCSLACRMATCWSSNCKALDNYLYLWHPVKKLTNNPGLNLHHLALDTTQRELALELNKALEVFELPTQHFSMGSVPHVHQVLPALVMLRDALATLNVYNKYMENMSICKVYFISLVMCPDVKLSWFYQHYSLDLVEAICNMVLARLEISYPLSSNTLASSSQSPEPIQKASSHAGRSYPQPTMATRSRTASQAQSLFNQGYMEPTPPPTTSVEYGKVSLEQVTQLLLGLLGLLGQVKQLKQEITEIKEAGIETWTNVENISQTVDVIKDGLKSLQLHGPRTPEGPQPKAVEETPHPLPKAKPIGLVSGDPFWSEPSRAPPGLAQPTPRRAAPPQVPSPPPSPHL